MYMRVVELTSKSGKARELCNTIDDKVLPILKRQAGFVDETVRLVEPDADARLQLQHESGEQAALRLR